MIDYPINSGGRPLIPGRPSCCRHSRSASSAPSLRFHRIDVGDRLPRLHHPLFEIERFEREPGPFSCSRSTPTQDDLRARRDRLNDAGALAIGRSADEASLVIMACSAYRLRPQHDAARTSTTPTRRPHCGTTTRRGRCRHTRWRKAISRATAEENDRRRDARTAGARTQRFNIYCAPCHGIGGDGDGIIVRAVFRASVLSRAAPAGGAGLAFL